MSIFIMEYFVNSFYFACVLRKARFSGKQSVFQIGVLHRMQASKDIVKSIFLTYIFISLSKKYICNQRCSMLCIYCASSVAMLPNRQLFEFSIHPCLFHVDWPRSSRVILPALHPCSTIFRQCRAPNLTYKPYGDIRTSARAHVLGHLCHDTWKSLSLWVSTHIPTFN